MGDNGSPFFLLLIPLIAAALCWLLASVSGWTRLAALYRADKLVLGERAYMRTGRIGPVNYHSVLSFRCNEHGLAIAVVWPLRFGHPPLFIPWSEFHRVAPDAVLYSRRVKASIGNPAIVRVVLPGWVRYRMPTKLGEARAG